MEKLGGISEAVRCTGTGWKVGSRCQNRVGCTLVIIRLRLVCLLVSPPLLQPRVEMAPPYSASDLTVMLNFCSVQETDGGVWTSAEP